jgi:integrase
MDNRYRLFRRSWGTYYDFDNLTGQQFTLKTKDSDVAQELLQTRNEANREPLLNRQKGIAYLECADPQVKERTWQDVMDDLVQMKRGSNRERWDRVVRQEVFTSIRNQLVYATHPEHFLKVLKSGTVSTNVYLRRIHNYALDMGWLPRQVIPKRHWPKIRHKEKRAVTKAEHKAIVAREKNSERRAFYELLWHLGGSPSDIAKLEAIDIDCTSQTASFFRKKSGELALIHFGPQAAKILKLLPATGPLFPYLQGIRAADRATEFKQRCDGLGLSGISLHSYRYAWAERAKEAGMPERFAMQALGHNSKAVHRAYAKKALVKVPSLEEYESSAAGKIVPMARVS